MDDKKVFTKLLGLRLPWFITNVEIDEERNRVDIYIGHEKDIQVKCPVCQQFYSMYDHGPERIFRHLNTMDMETYIHVRPPRVNCPDHGVKQIDSEFGENGSDMTYAFESHVINVAHECSIEATGRLLGLSWDRGWNVLERAVGRGQKRKPHKISVRISVDEKSFTRGHKYETIVSDIDNGTVEFICDDREQESLEKYYQQFTVEERKSVKAVAMDMWDPFIAATKKYIPGANEKIVFDRFHVMRCMLEAVDKTRKEEHKQLKEAGNEILIGTKYIWLWNKENVPEWRKEEYNYYRSLDLKTSRASAIKDNLRHLWDYHYEASMRKYFKRWYFWATHSRLPHVKKAAQTIKSHIDNIYTYAKHRITNALGESINAKIEKVKRFACGFRNRAHYRTAIYFHCGGLDLFPYPPTEPSLRFRQA